MRRIAGIPSASACGNEPFGRYTAVRRRREVCIKSVYNLPASKGLTVLKYTLRYDYCSRPAARYISVVPESLLHMTMVLDPLLGITLVPDPLLGMFLWFPTRC